MNVNEYVIYVYEDGSALCIDRINEMNDMELDSLINLVMAEKKYRNDIKYEDNCVSK